ncbi:MAG: hypothetical protein E6J84_06980 [Deltaproteobacteria bacterium]|nr:MAG: hypothetical protein E6J84_06980 [Deltaproteobacteria bacterium]
MPACRRIPGRDPRSTNFRRRFVPRSSAAAMLLALAATFATGALADPPPSRSLRAARRIGEIRIDGRPDEAAWRAADVGDSFLQTEPDDGQPATAPTRFRVLWDDDSLYVAIECDDPQPPTALASPRDRDIDADLVRIDLDTTLDRRTAYHFGVYAAGQQVDGMHFNDDDYTSDWDAAWESAVATTPSGWSVEMRIPLRVLRVPEGAHAFGLNVARTLTRRHEESTWQYRPREAAGVVSGFGLLTGLDGLRPVVQLDLKPYVAGRGNCGTATAPATPCQTGFDLDLFNLPLSSAYQIFYSRRIGEAPVSPLLGPNDTLIADAGARNIAGAAKVSGKTGPYSVQALTAFEPRAYARVLSADGRAGDQLAAEAAQATALRVRRALSDSAVSGFAVTALDPFGFADRHAFAAAADTVVFDADRDWNASVQVAGSLLAGGTDSVLLDGTVLGAGARGWAASTRLARDGGALNASFSADVLSPKFWVNDLGFMDRGNLIDLRPALTVRDLHPQGRWQKASLRLSAEDERNFDGFLLRRSLSLDSSVTLNSYWSGSLSTTLFLPAVDDRELGDGTPLARPGAVRVSADVGTDSRQSLTASFSISQQLSEGMRERKTAIGADLKFRPYPALEAGVSVTYENDGGAIRRIRGATGVPEMGGDPAVDLDPAGATRSWRLYLLAPQYAQSVSAILRAAAALGPHLSVQAFAQLFTEGVAYGDPMRAVVAPGRATVQLDGLPRAGGADQPAWPDQRDADLSLNLVLRWEWRVGSNLYLAYAHQTSGSASPNDHRLSLFGETGALAGPGATRGDALMLKIDMLTAL